MQPLLDVLVQHVPPPSVSVEQPFAMCVAMIERDPFVGRIATGEVGSMAPGVPCLQAFRLRVGQACNMMWTRVSGSVMRSHLSHHAHHVICTAPAANNLTQTNRQVA